MKIYIYITRVIAQLEDSPRSRLKSTDTCHEEASSPITLRNKRGRAKETHTRPTRCIAFIFGPSEIASSSFSSRSVTTRSLSLSFSLVRDSGEWGDEIEEREARKRVNRPPIITECTRSKWSRVERSRSGGREGEKGGRRREFFRGLVVPLGREISANFFFHRRGKIGFRDFSELTKFTRGTWGFRRGISQGKNRTRI